VKRHSLSPASITYARTPELVRRGLARHDARLAVDIKVQGQGLGGQLLLSAGNRCLLASAASCGALPLLDAPLSLLLPLTTVEAALKAARK